MSKYFRILALILSACILFSACAGTGGGVTDTNPGDDTVNTDNINTESAQTGPKETEPVEIDPKDDLELDTVSDAKNGAFYDAFPDGSNKWTAKTEKVSLLAKDGMLQVTMSEYGDDRVISRGWPKTSDRFELEFRLRVTSEGRRVGIRFDYGKARIYMLIYPDAVMFRGAGDNIDNINLKIHNDWHTYRIVVDGDIAHLYFDGIYVTSFEPQTGSFTNGFVIFGAAITGRDLKFDFDYISYTPLESKVTLLDIENNSVYTDTSRLSLSVRVDSDIDGEANEVIYRANGVRIGSSDKKNVGYQFDWENIQPGKYCITADYGDHESVGMYVTFGEDGSSDYKAELAESRFSTEDELLGSYELSYRLTSADVESLNVLNGKYRLNLEYSAGAVNVLTAAGTLTANAGVGNYRVLADGSSAWLYKENRLILSFTLPTDFSAPNISSTGGITGLEVGGLCGAYYSYAVEDSFNTTLDDFGNRYIAEFTFDGGENSSVMLYDGYYKAYIRIEDGVVYGLSAPKLAMSETALAEVSDSMHCAELRVAGGIALLYIDGAWAGSIRLPESDARRFVSLKGKMSFELRDYDDKYYLDIDFGDDTWKDYLAFSDDGAAGVTDGSLVLKESKNAYTVTTENFAKNSSYTVNVDFSGKTDGVFYLMSRYTNEYSALYAGYNFNTGKYEIRNISKTVKSLTADAPTGKTELTMVTSDNVVTLYVNGEAVISAEISVMLYANSGIMTDGGVSVSEISYVGDGFVQPSQYEWLDTKSGYPDIVELSDGTLLMADEGSGMMSADGGTSWTKASGVDTSNLGKNAIVLQSGKLLVIKRSSAAGTSLSMDMAYISSDDGKTFSGPFQVQGKNSYRITMNCKLTQMLSGRLFFVTGETGHAVEHSAEIGIYYSDNEGMTWKKAETEVNYKTTGMNLQEGCIVDLGNGTLRLYIRSDMGYLYYSDSTDGGITWDLEFKPSLFASVCSAFNVERDPETGYIWLAWEYNCTNDNGTIQYPRTRVGLAVSTDNGKNFLYVADVDDFNYSTDVYHWNIGINVTSKYVFVTVIKAVLIGEKQVESRNYVVRFEKDKIITLARFTPLRPMKTGNIKTDYYNEVLKNSLIVSGGYEFIAGERSMGNEFNGGKTYVALESIAELINGTYTSAGGSSSVKFGKTSWSFTDGSDICSCYAEIKLGSKAQNIGGELCIAIEDAAKVFELETYITEKAYGMYYSPFDIDFAFAAVNCWAE